ncbi:MAG: tRNA-uridine aminocarboxypropyltransferase, partial [Planctomycetota bacterium]
MPSVTDSRSERVETSPAECESKRCFRCFRPHAACYCDLIPRIANRTSVVILQHRRERFHPFNTARIVQRALMASELMVGHNHELSHQFAEKDLADDVRLLFPGDDAPVLSDLPPGDRPSQLVIPDGTWHQVKTLMRDVPRLQSLGRVRLAPASPGRYRIRREPDEHSLSTLEATHAALSVLEPQTAGLEELVGVFDRMIADQLNHPTSNWRQNRRRRLGAPNVPRVITSGLENLVVAYGECEPGNLGEDTAEDARWPVSWTAVRLVGGQTFDCMIRSESLADTAFLDRLGVSPESVDSAVGRNEFRDRWRDFLRPRDQVVVRLPGTQRLLR